MKLAVGKNTQETENEYCLCAEYKMKGDIRKRIVNWYIMYTGRISGKNDGGVTLDEGERGGNNRKHIELYQLSKF